MTSQDTSRAVTFDGINLQAERVCNDPDGYDRIAAWDPDTGQRLVEISWHRDTRKLGVILHGDRRWSFEAVEEMRRLGMEALWWSAEAAQVEGCEKNSVESAAAG
ncbi:hypothetical protein [Sphingomonas bisphenolicum]|uniref:Uncharacterized protein n=1 Tax=Sphingomonas bisphenolicum TaxID=296544 RepID=A0ABN5W974_9SPHN|nr:hypothetical protein [Sphingomonas bisphenolicum]BBF68824.1 hypothetical protein SBA_ch1_10240 [Sphingomonas bisphenolicum]